MEIRDAKEPTAASVDDAPTRERVVRSILENGASTAAALAERLALTPAAVRRHLDHLLGARGLKPSGNAHPGKPRSPAPDRAEQIKKLEALLADPSGQRHAMALTMQRLGQGGEPPGLRAARSVLANL